MARITCAISGIKFNTSYLEGTSFPHTLGYFHPIFAASYHTLHILYVKHCKGELSSNDSYLLFIAFLQSSEQILWKHPAALNPNSSSTKQLIENNLAQLIAALEKSAVIQHPAFKQPSFVVTYENSNLGQITNWINAWEDNIKEFKEGRISLHEEESFKKLENKLSKYILSGSKQEDYANIIADWACRAGAFPTNKAVLYKSTICNCFNINKMFNTPLPLLKEVKEFCESHIEAGSIHLHTLMQVIREGIFKHIDYLGGSSLALEYTLLPSLPTKESRKQEHKGNKELQKIIDNVPTNKPKRADYKTPLDFLRAQLSFKVATIALTNTKNIT